MNLTLFTCVSVVPGANVTLYIGYLMWVGISAQCNGLRSWHLMFSHILVGMSRIKSLSTTVKVFSEVSV